jgi:hypothetical protein
MHCRTQRCWYHTIPYRTVLFNECLSRTRNANHRVPVSSCLVLSQLVQCDLVPGADPPHRLHSIPIPPPFHSTPTNPPAAVPLPHAEHPSYGFLYCTVFATCCARLRGCAYQPAASETGRLTIDRSSGAGRPPTGGCAGESAVARGDAGCGVLGGACKTPRVGDWR